MPKSTSRFSITVGPLPLWYPSWQSPGVIKSIPNSSLKAAIEANGWTQPNDIVAGGTGWPKGLYSYSGGTVAYVAGQPYLCISGGGHATHADNSIYAFGPLFGTGSDNPAWMRLGKQTADADIRTCTQHNADGRPTSRHTVGDFSYGRERIVMLWMNSAYCSTGGTGGAIDVFDVTAREWDNAKPSPVTHPKHDLDPNVHSMSCFHPHTNLFYAKGRGAQSDSFGSYDPVNRRFVAIQYSGFGNEYDSCLCTMGPRNYVYFFKSSGASAGRINVKTGVGEEWGRNLPGDTRAAVAYDLHLDRIYTPTTGVSSNNEGMPAGSRTVAWLDASATSNPQWQSETFHGDTPDQQLAAGTWGRWSYVPELRGFVLNNSWDSPVFFYRTSE